MSLVLVVVLVVLVELLLCFFHFVLVSFCCFLVVSLRLNLC